MIKKHNIIGLMSGTSLDGLDLALCSFYENDQQVHYEILSAATMAYDKRWQKKLTHAHKLSGLELTHLNIEFGVQLGKMVNAFLLKINLKKTDINCIASHGHTIFHQPEHGFTLQIGHGAYIAETTGINTICDFRVQDMAKGGQGAPLVPIGDQLLFGNYGCCINLGGIANVSYEQNSHRIAYDICPANMVLNYLSQKLGKQYDQQGKIAASGQFNQSLFDDFNKIEYYQQNPPKTLGREWVEQNIFPILEKSDVSIADKLHTFCHHIGKQIHTSTAHLPQSTILLTGGGAWNTFLTESIKQYTAHTVIIPNEQLVGFKEALVFALLAYLKINNKPNVLASVTGAKNDHIAGVEFKIK